MDANEAAQVMIDALRANPNNMYLDMTVASAKFSNTAEGIYSEIQDYEVMSRPTDSGVYYAEHNL